MIELPDKVKVGPMIYDIIYPYDFEIKDGTLGLTSTLNGTIKVVSLYNGRECCDQQIREVFLHELIHAIDYVYCGEILEENHVEVLGVAYNQLFADNDLKLSEPYYIPSNIKIAGKTWDIKYPYLFADSPDSISYTDHMACTIYLIDESSGTKLCNNALKIHLMSALYIAVRQSFFDNDTLQVLSDLMNIHCLGIGLYQTFVDNDLEKLWT